LYTTVVQLAKFISMIQPLVAAELQAALREFQVRELELASSHLLGLGKLFRPTLALAVYHALGGRQLDDVVRFVAPLEIIHTFTLIHDDLPCMDDAQLRRGQAAVHLAHGEAMAVLAGDALLNLALMRLAQAPGPISSELRLQLMISATRATHDVVEGQVLDLLGEGQDWDQPRLARLHRLKTGALLGACCEFGGVLGEAEPGLVRMLHELGLNVGLAFQMRDDLLSQTSTVEAMGKTISTDDDKQKATYARLFGVARAEQMLIELTAANLRQIDKLGLPDPGLLKEIAAAADKRQS
jgi:geranylgeranyl pyrophosphate synthase